MHGLLQGYSGQRAAVSCPKAKCCFIFKQMSHKSVEDRVPSDIRNDRANQFLESSGTQRRCVVYGLKSRCICHKCDIGVHTPGLVRALIFPTVLYGCETWTITKSMEKKINACEMWIWRKMLRISRREKGQT
jgi:hypothetical protein